MNLIKKLTKPKFNYNKFEDNLYKEVCKCFIKYSNRKDDIYTFSLNYYPEYTTFVSIIGNTYSHLKKKIEEEHLATELEYKYSEGEWEFEENLEDLSKEMQVYFDALEKWASFDEDLQLDLKQEHTDNMIELCCRVMRKVKLSDEYKLYPKLNLNVFVEDGEIDVPGIFEELNDEEAISELKEFYEMYGE